MSICAREELLSHVRLFSWSWLKTPLHWDLESVSQIAETAKPAIVLKKNRGPESSYVCLYSY